MKNRTWIYPTTLIVFLFMISNSCNIIEIKIAPVITWANPEDISYGTLLSEVQLNATADVSGTFIYTPATGTKLNEGDNQELKVDFTPTDLATYSTTSKSVMINVKKADSILFNPKTTYGSLTDIDGNKYKTIILGGQTWMAENLKTTRYNDGTAIPKLITDNEWTTTLSGAFCNYENHEINVGTYGRLYNWYAVNSGKLCPAGWHIPTQKEWKNLTSSIGGEEYVGIRLKETGTSHWKNDFYGATNSTGFTALPGGYRSSSGSYWDKGNSGIWWSSDETTEEDAYFRGMPNDWNQWISSFEFSKKCGLSIRCVKDN